MRVIHVVSTIDAEAAGPSYSVPRLCAALQENGVGADLAAVGALPAAASPHFVKMFPYGRGPRRLGFSPALRRWLRESAASGDADIIHGHGVWMMPNIYPAWACRGSRCRLVVSSRGMLTAWAMAHHAFRKKIIWHVAQGAALRSAACFHATADSELEDIRSLGFSQPVCLIPNGVDVPPEVEAPARDRRRLLYLGRIHEKKGVDLLLRAWAAVERKMADWDLCVAGPGDSSYVAEMQTLAGTLGVKRVIFAGPLYGDAKLRAYRDASLFVLPSYSENFGMTVAEALASGTPAIVSKGAPWSGLDARNAGWWIDVGVDPLVACLERALVQPESRLTEMGLAGRDWMIQDFSWGRIGAQFAQVYEWLVNGGPRPVTVQVD